MAKQQYRGHQIHFDGWQWVYSDNKQPVMHSFRLRGCGHCGKPDTPEGHDACLGTLPGVMNACCGHGSTDDAYVQLGDGSVLQGRNALLYIDVTSHTDGMVRIPKSVQSAEDFVRWVRTERRT